MANTESFARLMARLRSGEDAAAREVFERFAGRLVALARGRFNRLLARKVDPEDVVQSAFKSFFVRHREGKLDVGDSGGLWNLLTLITLRKCADRAEYFLAERRDAAREATGSAGGDGPDACLGALDREPRPEEAVILAETVERLFRDATTHERPVLELSLQGYTTSEISVRLGRAERSVRRLREQIRVRLERLQEAD
ncbi:RNA polymerase sigma-70 factor, ECF subfamily [Singulisphaera sp. GP187]|uniref:RNA polymerase sigma factor n=1 Tax=Singulisphaera sp. GP187 TaxID=1882752 RepID=UPI0009274452|nr:ECF-type sigma factor [Singulisphaera sp. GP187]SIO58812.1 RNA polymerase sigma-70 factor, ECF subfamily [Singulisphaera sp. GP187]